MTNEHVQLACVNANRNQRVAQLSVVAHAARNAYTRVCANTHEGNVCEIDEPKKTVG